MHLISPTSPTSVATSPPDTTPDHARQGGSTLLVEPWADAVIDQLGHDPRSVYVEQYWLPVLGPTCILFLRRVADALDVSPDGVDLDLADTARALGLGVRATRHGPLARAIERCCSFGMGRPVSAEHILVRRKLPPLTRRQVNRLPSTLRDRHEMDRADARTHQATSRQRQARALALSLLESGEPYDSAERQLHRWQHHPAVAHDALRWATEQRELTTAPGSSS